MFTGIIEDIGKVKKVSKNGDFYSLCVSTDKILNGTQIGDSIAVNGVCLTVTSIGMGDFTADVMSETISKTSLKNIKAGCDVNLERAATLSTRLGGHLVSGHVDEVGFIESRTYVNNSYLYVIKVTQDLMPYIAPKGSITVDGISLTVINTSANSFSVGIIPHTLEQTILKQKNKGGAVNVEVDLMARYITNYIEKSKSQSSFDWDSIAKGGI